MLAVQAGELGIASCTIFEATDRMQDGRMVTAREELSDAPK